MAPKGSSSADSVGDGLKNLFPQIAQLKLLPDAQQHMQFITALESAIMQYLQQIAGQAAAMGSPGQGPQAGGGGAGPAPTPAGPPPGAAQAAQFAPGGAAGGGNVGLAPQMSPDEMQRIMTNVGGNG